MVSSPTSSLKLAKQATGDNLNTHGVVLNEQVIDLIDEAVAQQVTISLTGNHTLTSTNYASNEARQSYLIFTDGGLGSVPTVTAPSIEKWWWIKNAGSTYAITFGVSGGTSVSIPAGKTVAVFSDGTDCEKMDLANLGGSLPLASIDGGEDISTVAGIAADVTAVAAIDTDVTAVAAIDGNVTTVAGVSANVTTVAGISANVTTVAGISANVTTVAGDSADIQALAAITADISAAAAIDTDISTVAGVSANVTTVATNIADVTTCAANIADIQDAANLFGDVVQGPGSSTDNYVPRWDGTGGDTLKAGLAVGTSANNLVQLDGSGNLPAVDGSALTGIETGSLTLLNETEISVAVASVEWTGLATGTYKHFLVEIVEASLSATGYLRIQLSPDAGSTWRTTGYVGESVRGTTILSETTGLATTHINSTTAADVQSGRFIVLEMASATEKTQMSGIGAYTASTAYRSSLAVCQYDTAETHDSIRVITNTGDIDAGTFRLYGVN